MKCDRVIPGYYYALSDNLKYEAEDARGIGVREELLTFYILLKSQEKSLFADVCICCL